MEINTMPGKGKSEAVTQIIMYSIARLPGSQQGSSVTEAKLVKTDRRIQPLDRHGRRESIDAGIDLYLPAMLT